MACFVQFNLCELTKMKKVFLFIILLLPLVSFACSSCNVEYSDDEKKAFVVATALLIILPFTAVYLVYKFLKKNYR